MEMEGIVSVWAGIFETDKALKEYFDDMPGRDISPFSRDFLMDATSILLTQIFRNGVCMNLH
ncbi:hypothetical protein D1641_17960 [Colidextribacter sp. OB.20]|uniref:hypothetical protein n=1 Tax=Colidextribacter sp. OB.20 TaxID=2304568 RepID=UPI001367CC8E|nr:hypothetical protein [Colidextribacter sp. OB.20]NBI11854.1 hypothetical protein [Colidextribacter sp. OB.20]